MGRSIVVRELLNIPIEGFSLYGLDERGFPVNVSIDVIGKTTSKIALHVAICLSDIRMAPEIIAKCQMSYEMSRATGESVNLINSNAF